MFASLERVRSWRATRVKDMGDVVEPRQLVHAIAAIGEIERQVSTGNRCFRRTPGDTENLPITAFVQVLNEVAPDHA